MAGFACAAAAIVLMACAPAIGGIIGAIVALAAVGALVAAARLLP